MDRIFLGFPPLPRALKLLAGLDEERFGTLSVELAGPEAFDTAEDRVVRLRGLLGLDAEADVVDLLQALRFLYDRCREWESEGQDFSDPLRSFLRATKIWAELGADAERVFERLTVLLKLNVTVERKAKLRWLRTGMLENAVEFASFLDLRPDFSKDRTHVAGVVPAFILRIRIENDLEKEHSYVFQLTEDGLKKLRKTVDDLEMKLEAARRLDGLASLIDNN